MSDASENKVLAENDGYTCGGDEVHETEECYSELVVFNAGTESSPDYVKAPYSYLGYITFDGVRYYPKEYQHLAGPTDRIVPYFTCSMCFITKLKSTSPGDKLLQKLKKIDPRCSEPSL
jgi:hypothetical protein